MSRTATLPHETPAPPRAGDYEPIMRLTFREAEVLRLVAAGHSSKEAANILVVSKRTVDFHLANVFRKLGVSNRVLAMRAAGKYGFWTIGE